MDAAAREAMLGPGLTTVIRYDALDDVDVVLVNGFGFPRWRGGPLFHADATGLARVLDDLRAFAREDDRLWQASPSLERLVEQDRALASLNGPAD